MWYLSSVLSAAEKPHPGRKSRTWTSSFALLTRFRRKEDGSIIMFSLFLFIMMVMVGGMAVDLMRFETKRVKLQGTLDSATLAATNLQQSLDAELLIRDFMQKRGYNPDLVNIDVDPTYLGENSDVLVSRRVDATYQLSMDTFFMHMLDINTLSTTTGSAAFQGVQNVEISLVVDISGSMAGSRMTALKDAAKSFVRTVIDEDRTEGITTVSLIPYNDNVVVPDMLLDRLNTSGIVTIANPAPYPGALVDYPRTASNSKCVRFFNDQLITSNLSANYTELRAISPTTVLDRMAYYDWDAKSSGGGGAFNRPADTWNRRCDPQRTAILPLQSTIAPLEAAIDGLQADGWTAIDNGMKWATALLDPEFRPIVNDLVDNDLLSSRVADLPGDYDPANTMKVIVLMTDGANTNQYDLADEFKNGPSRVWFSEIASREWGPEGQDWRTQFIVDSNQNGIRDRSKVWEDGYFVEMPNRPPASRFMRQHRFGTSGSNASDAVHYGISDLPSDIRQLDYIELYDRFSERAVAELFRDNKSGFGDAAALNAHWNAERLVHDGNSADRRLSGSPRTSTTQFGICDAAKYIRPGEDQPDILVFSIAFQAGTHATNVMRDCATAPDYFYPAENEDKLREAFAAIAGAITMLRLTQ